MRPALWIIAALAVGAAAGATGVRLGQQMPWLTHHAEPAQAAEGPVLYYQHPDGTSEYSTEPTKTADGRPFIPVREGTEATPAKPAAGASRRILYYRNPMGLPDVSKTPKKDSMGMDYIPVYEGDENDDATVKLSAGKVQRSGVKTDLVERRLISQPLRAAGTVQLDERRIAVITLRTEAFIDRVENVTTGSVVRKGEPLMVLYSPAIASAAAEYLALIASKVEPTVPQGTRQRLLNYNVPPALLQEIERERKVPITFTWTAPRSGVILERNVTAGARVAPGDVLFRIADLSTVWAMIDIPERAIGAVREGQSVTVNVRGFPGKTFAGTIGLIYPALNAATRTIRARVDLANPELLLRADMYLEAFIESGAGSPVIAVPESAVIDSGDRRFVILDKGEGRFQPRPVLTGARGNGYVEVTEGLAAGDRVVTAANFLIDAESNLKAALRGLSSESAAP